MYYFEYPVVDTTIYEGNVSSSINTGIDQILEVRKEVNSTGTTVGASRILIKFDYSYITNQVNSGVIPSDAKYYLNLYDASSESWLFYVPDHKEADSKSKFYDTQNEVWIQR